MNIMNNEFNYHSIHIEFKNLLHELDYNSMEKTLIEWIKILENLIKNTFLN